MMTQSNNVRSTALFLAFLGFVIVTAPSQAAENSVVERAKSEGEVVLYSAWGFETLQLVQKAFAKKYPFIKLNVLRMRSERLLSRTAAEHKQKIFSADLFSGSQLAMLNHKREGHLQKYLSPEHAAFPKEFKDPDGFWTAFNVDTRVVAFNPRLVARDQLPRSYDDLLSPKWKGKMGMDEFEYTMFGSLLEIMGREKGLAYMRRLAQQDLNIRSGHSLLTQLLLGGEFPLYIDGFGGTIEQVKAQGAPIDWIGLEPVIVSLYPVGMALNAPHPNAARLLLDFLLSKEGQEIARSVAKIPGRADVEAPFPRLTKGLKLFTVPASVAERYGEIVAQFREIFLK
jgi:iron(III) transport system substrate-binding protein